MSELFENFASVAIVSAGAVSLDDALAAFTLTVLRAVEQKERVAAKAMEEMLADKGRPMRQVFLSKGMQYKTYRSIETADKLPAYDIGPDDLLPSVVADLIGGATLRQAFHDAVFDSDTRCCACGNAAPTGTDCAVCTAHAEAFLEDEERQLGISYDPNTGDIMAHLDRMNELEDWIESIGGDEALAEMSDEAISQAFNKPVQAVQSRAV